MTRRGSPRPIEEREFHRWLVRHLRSGRDPLLPLGDDVAAIPLGGRRVLLLTTDALSEGTHFRRESDPYEIGQATAAASLSDLAAKGGSPAAGLLDLLLPPGTPRRWAERVVEGAERFGRRFGAPVVGGDTKPAAGRAVVGTYIGFGRADRLAPRHGARPGDWVVVTGTVGAGGRAALGLQRPSTRPRALSALLHVEPRVAAGQRLVRWAHAMTDTSDGLAAAAHLVAEASHVRMVIDEAQIPWDSGLPSTDSERDRRLAVGLFGGDYELFTTMPPNRCPTARRALRRLGLKLTPVGVVLPGRGAWLRSPDSPLRPMPAPGWDPFHPKAP